MNILFLSDNFPPEHNAAAARVHERACYWVRSGHRVTVVTCAPNFPEGAVFAGYENRRQVEWQDGIRVVRVRTFIAPNTGLVLRTFDFLSYMFSAVAAGMYEDTPDLIAATSPQLFAALGGWILARLRRVPFVFELGDLWPASIEAVGALRSRWLLGLLEQLELFLYRQSAAIVALTRRFREDLVRRGIPPEKIRVVRNGVDLTRFAPRPHDSGLTSELGLGGRFVVGYLGTLGMAHGMRDVLEAADLLRGERDVRFLLVGTGAERATLVEEARTRGIHNVVFVRPQPRSAMPRYWSLCDAALVHLKADPIFESVIPSKMFEAMGMGLPILLVAPPGEAREVMEAAGAGLWTPAARPDLLVESVLRLKYDEALRARLAEASRAAAAGHSREQQAREMLDVFEAVLRAA